MKTPSNLSIGLADVLAARERLRGSIYESPCQHSIMLSALTGQQVPDDTAGRRGGIGWRTAGASGCGCGSRCRRSNGGGSIAGCLRRDCWA